MIQKSLDEAKRHLEELLAAALRGERVVIEDDAQHAVQLVPVTPAPPAMPTKPGRRAGTAKGKIVMADDFDSPLPDFVEYTQ